MTAISATGLGFDVDGAGLVVDVDLSVEPGELLGVVGPNGAGKSTLVGLLSGELTPTSGTVTLHGEDVTGLDTTELARRRAVLPQHTVLQFAFRCLEVVLMGRFPHESGESEDMAVAHEVMADTDTSDLSDRVYTTLSGGEQTRVSLARVLAQSCPIVFLDEPTGSLDIRHQELVMSTLRGLADEGGAVVAVLHDLNLAARYAHRVALMGGGSVVAVDETRDVLRADLLSEVYRHPIEVVEHPRLSCPLVLPGDGAT